MKELKKIYLRCKASFQLSETWRFDKRGFIYFLSVSTYDTIVFSSSSTNFHVIF